MAAAARVIVTGLPEIRRQLRALERGTSDLREANAAAAAAVAAAAATRAPRKTGKLAASIRGNRAAGRATVSAGGARLPYAGPIHYGWPAHGIEAHPFLTSAAKDTEPVWLPAYLAAVSRVVDNL